MMILFFFLLFQNRRAKRKINLLHVHVQYVLPDLELANTQTDSSFSRSDVRDTCNTY